MPYLKTACILEHIPEEELKAVRASCGLRRADRLTSLAAAAIRRALPKEFPHGLPAETGLLTMSAFGPHKTVFAMLDDILDFPEDQLLPTKFTHSVHNAVTSYLGTLLGFHGPAFALTNFGSPIFELFETAETILAGGLCSQVLAVAVEERGLLTQVATQFSPEDFPSEPPEAVAVFLLTGGPEGTLLTLDHTRCLERQPDSPFGLPTEILEAFRKDAPVTLGQ